MLNLSPIRFRWRESVSLGRFQNCNLLKPDNFRHHGVEDESEQVAFRKSGVEERINWSDEDGAFVAEVPELPGCMAHGATQKAALGNEQDAIRLWIDRSSAPRNLGPGETRKAISPAACRAL
jgi:predicted RNase H-like HicB family nuclease